MAETPSFAINPAEPVLVRPDAAPTLGRLSGDQARAFAPQMLQTPDVGDGTIGLLTKLGGAFLDKAIEKKQQEVFLVGAQRVAQGEALADIIEEQPWYTEIFGPSAEVQGARAVAQVAQVDKYTQSLYEDMPRLQTISPDAVGKEVNSKMLQFMTGDTATDIAIQGKMVEASGAFYTAHTKAHYKWNQTNMQRQVESMMMASADKFQAANQQRLEGTLSENDWAVLQSQAAQSMQPLPGQSPDSYWKAITDATEAAMANGNHHYSAIVFGSGLLDHAPADIQTKMLDARTKYEARTVEREGYLEFGAEIGRLKGLARAGQISPAQIATEVNRMNEMFRLKTGIEGDLFSRKEFSAMLAGDYAAIFNRQERNARDAAKAQAKAQVDLAKQHEVVQMVQVGAANQAIWAGHKREDVDTAFYSGTRLLMQNAGNWSGLAIDSYNNGGYVNRYLQNDMQQGLRAATLEGHTGENFDRTFQMYRAMSAQPGGKATALAYLGKEDGVRMMKYESLVNSKIAPEVAWQASFGQPVTTGRKSTDKEVVELIDKRVVDDQPGFIDQLAGGLPLSPVAQRILTGRIAANYDLLAQNLALSDEAAISAALDVAKNEVDIVGAFAYEKSASRLPFSALIGADQKAAGDFFTNAVVAAARKNGVRVKLPNEKSDGGVQSAVDLVLGGPLVAAKNAWDKAWGGEPNINIIRLPDQVGENGVPYGSYAVTVVGDDGKMTMFNLDSRELRKQYEASKNFKE